MGAGVRDAFPPPMCKCITEMGRDGWCRLGGLRVGGFVCVGCVEKYDGDG